MSRQGIKSSYSSVDDWNDLIQEVAVCSSSCDTSDGLSCLLSAHRPGQASACVTRVFRNITTVTCDLKDLQNLCHINTLWKHG
jgi:hypothetical protein